MENRIILGETKLSEAVKQAKNQSLQWCYGYVFVPHVNASLLEDAGLQATGAVQIRNPQDGRLMVGSLVTGFAPKPVLKKFQVSYKAGARWGSRVVMAVSQDAANKQVAEEIAATIGARPVR